MNFISIIGFSFSGLGFFLSSFYLLRNRFKNDNYLFLYLSLALMAYEIFYKSLIHSKLIYDFLLLYVPGRFYNLLLLPIFLFFIWSITRKDFSLRKSHYALLLLFLAYLFLGAGKALGISFTEKAHMLDLFYEDKRPGPFNYWSNWNTGLKSSILPLFILGLISYDFFTFRAKLTSLQNKRLLNFLTAIIILYILYYQLSNWIYLLAYQLTSYSLIEWPVDILFLSTIVLLLSVLCLSINAGDSFFPPTKYAGSSLKEVDYEGILSRLITSMKEESLYTDQELSLEMLSKKLGINPKYLSQTLNAHLELGYIDFINQYRIEEAKRLLLKGENKSLTIEAIGKNAGFKSKSSFFRAFKKHTGQTPQQYLKSIENQPK